jgi:hypothetical protein
MGLHLSELVYNPQVGHDVAVKIPLDYDPKKYTTHEEAAKALGAALRKVAVSKYGYTPGLAQSEISVWAPERTVQYSGNKQWCVVWEGGPYDWAISLSFDLRGPWGYCEPYYGFDLHFTD